MKKVTEEVKINETAPETPDVSALEQQIAELNDKYIRAMAEIENTRRRAALDADNAGRNARAGMAENFLPLADAIETALAHAPCDPGMIAMKSALDSVLERSGITRIESVGLIPDPRMHNVVSVVNVCPCDAKPGTITSELQTGYMIGDSVLRNAMVIVAS